MYYKQNHNTVDDLSWSESIECSSIYCQLVKRSYRPTSREKERKRLKAEKGGNTLSDHQI